MAEIVTSFDQLPLKTDSDLRSYLFTTSSLKLKSLGVQSYERPISFVSRLLCVITSGFAVCSCNKHLQCPSYKEKTFGLLFRAGWIMIHQSTTLPWVSVRQYVIIYGRIHPLSFWPGIELVKKMRCPPVLSKNMPPAT